MSMKTLETLLAEYKKFGVQFNEQENKITIPETSGFDGMCGMPLKEKIRAVMDENGIDHSNLIWLIDGDYDWKQYFKQVDEERKDDPKDVDLRIFKNHIKEDNSMQNQNIADESKLPAGLFAECTDAEFEKINKVMEKYGCMPLPGTYPWSNMQNYAVSCPKEKIPELLEEIKQIRGIDNIKFVDEKYLHKMHNEEKNKANTKDQFDSFIDSLPEKYKTVYYNMENTIKELTFYGVMLDNIADIIEDARKTSTPSEFIEKIKNNNKPILFSVPSDSILLYHGIKAAGDEFCQAIAKRIRKDLFPTMEIRCMCKTRSDVWGITEVAMAGKHLADYFENAAANYDEYKSVD